MSKITWDQAGERLYETGTKNGVLYVQDSNGEYPLGVGWNGLVGVSESPTGGEANPQYADDIKYINQVSREEMAGTIEAFTYPEEFEECDGSKELTPGVMVGQQRRKEFGMVYKTVLGNDVDDNDYGYKLHLIYGALASPSEKPYATINETPEAITFSWDFTTTPVEVAGFRPVASVVIDSTKVDATKLATLEDVLFGTAGTDPRLPLPAEVKTIIETTPDAISLDTIVPNDSATDVAIDTDITLTFNNEIVEENVLVMSTAGVPVAVTKTWDATGKILTVNPDANLSNATEYIVVVDGVVDIFAQLLATETANFTTIA